MALETIEKNFFPAHSTTEKREKMLTKTDSIKRTTIQITTQQNAEQNDTIGIYNIIIIYVWNVMHDFARYILQIRSF